MRVTYILSNDVLNCILSLGLKSTFVITSAFKEAITGIENY